MADKGKKSSMETFAPNDKADYYSEITSITVNGKNAYELKGKFIGDPVNESSDLEDISVRVIKEETARYVVPTGRVVVPTRRYVVPAGKVIIIVSPGRLSLVPTGRVLSPGRVK
ncbi:hypothetical protein Tco_0097631 [Tanacetum coccineum]